MSSPFLPETKRGTEESLEALNRTLSWASRIDTKNENIDVNIDSMVSELKSAEESLREEYIGQTVERAIDNFVVNNGKETQKIFTGTLDEKVSVLDELEDYIEDEFGYVSPPNFTKEELVWLVSQQFISYSYTPLEYPEEFTDRVDFSEFGEQPERWANKEYPAFQE